MFLRGKPAHVMPQQLVNHKNEFLDWAPMAEQMSLDSVRLPELPGGDAGRLAMSRHKVCQEKLSCAEAGGTEGPETQLTSGRALSK